MPNELTLADKSAVAAFHELVGHAFPDYVALCGRRNSPSVVLAEAHYFADLAFVTAAWRYSQSLGEHGPTVFAVGLFKWPPSASEMPITVV
jgi:hypothetical protein